MNTTTIAQHISTFISTHAWVIYALIVWSLAWKAVALWKAARLSHKVWFVIMLVANTLGILEIIYIFAIARKYTVVTKEDVSEKM